MAQTFTAASMGTAANSGDGNKLRAGGLAIAADLTELYDKVQDLETSALTAASIVRSKLSVAATGAANQTVAFTSQFVTNYALQIIDYEGLGIEVVSQDEDGFVITPGSAGNFGYIALIEQ